MDRWDQRVSGIKGSEHLKSYLPGVPAHVIQRGNNSQAVLFSDDDYLAYLRWLKEGAKQHGCTIHAYVLMTNHVHWLMTPAARDSIS